MTLPQAGPASQFNFPWLKALLSAGRGASIRSLPSLGLGRGLTLGGAPYISLSPSRRPAAISLVSKVIAPDLCVYVALQGSPRGFTIHSR